MAFYGCDFIFDGKRASTFLEPSLEGAPYKRLMLYNIGSYGQDDADLSVGEIEEDRIGRRYDPLLYGLRQNDPLQFTLVFGIDPDDLVGETCFTREEIARITQWLTGHQEYKVLKIDQSDMEHYSYKAMVTGLRLVSDGGLPVAFSAEITCDSPFAYKDAESYEIPFYMDSDPTQCTVSCDWMANVYFYPIIDIEIGGATYIEIVNITDGGRIMRIDNIPSGVSDIHIDCKNQIITEPNGYNLYTGFSMRFLRFIRGDNEITVQSDGTGSVSITCELPVNIGA